MNAVVELQERGYEVEEVDVRFVRCRFCEATTPHDQGTCSKCGAGLTRATHWEVIEKRAHRMALLTTGLQGFGVLAAVFGMSAFYLRFYLVVGCLLFFLGTVGFFASKIIRTIELQGLADWEQA